MTRFLAECGDVSGFTTLASKRRAGRYKKEHLLLGHTTAALWLPNPGTHSIRPKDQSERLSHPPTVRTYASRDKGVGSWSRVPTGPITRLVHGSMSPHRYPRQSAGSNRGERGRRSDWSFGRIECVPGSESRHIAAFSAETVSFPPPPTRTRAPGDISTRAQRVGYHRASAGRYKKARPRPRHSSPPRMMTTARRKQQHGFRLNSGNDAVNDAMVLSDRSEA
ncbi:hypothetical protein Scep_017683 [Stephania cephalantha]|uniref:Uncharacterized protein n=1 Tax=Stephania cephalantha TaxID=152367 RepID=A0AAP0NVW2_9MAGN